MPALGVALILADASVLIYVPIVTMLTGATVAPLVAREAVKTTSKTKALTQEERKDLHAMATALTPNSNTTVSPCTLACHLSEGEAASSMQ